MIAAAARLQRADGLPGLPGLGRGLIVSARPHAVVTLYGRPGCHLCDEAREQLLALAAGARFELREVDIESDDRLLAAYLERIPVVEVDGREVSELVLDRDAVRAGASYCRSRERLGP